jgi:hypothetical protein
MFITNLGKAGVSPKVAQALARHSDINLTMNVYSHVGLSDQASAVRDLPAPPQPNLKNQIADGKEALRSTGTDGRHVPQHVQTAVFNADFRKGETD